MLVLFLWTEVVAAAQLVLEGSQVACVVCGSVEGQSMGPWDLFVAEIASLGSILTSGVMGNPDRRQLLTPAQEVIRWIDVLSGGTVTAEDYYRDRDLDVVNLYDNPMYPTGDDDSVNLL